MKTSENTADLDAALAKAQAEMPNAAFNRVNPHFKSQYADLAAIREATLPSLTKHGLKLNHETHALENGDFVLYGILSFKGQQQVAEWPIPRGTPQAMGSSLTYGRRYTWAMLTGVASDEDDDANAAELATRLSQKAAPAPKAKKTAHAARQDGTDKMYQAIVDGLREQESLADLHQFWQNHQKEISGMPDEWLSFLQQEKDRLKELFKDDAHDTMKARSVADEIEDEIPDEGSGSDAA